jgi:regulator of sirC expression with transglutaminase-like and TPR domain
MGPLALSVVVFAISGPVFDPATPRTDAAREAATLVLRGDYWMGREEWDKALATFDEAVRLDPNSAGAHHGRGAARLMKGQLDAAVKDLDAAVRLDPKDPAALYTRGHVWVSKGDWGRAVADFTRVLELRPGDFRALNDRAAAHARRGDWDKAIADLDAAVRAEPDEPALYRGRGAAWAAKGDWDKAIADYDHLLGLDPADVGGLFGRGKAWHRKGDPGRAVTDFDEAIRLVPDHAEALCYRAWVRATCPDDRFRDGKRAVADARRACELTGWKAAECLDALAAACAEAGDFDGALEWAAKALRDPAFARAQGDAAWARYKLYEQRKPFRSADTSAAGGN